MDIEIQGRRVNFFCDEWTSKEQALDYRERAWAQINSGESVENTVLDSELLD